MEKPTLGQLGFEAHEFRVLTDALLHAMPMTRDTPHHQRDLLTSLSKLTYRYGKEGVIDAREALKRANQ